MIFQAVKMGVWLQAINSAPWLRRVIMAFVPQGIIEKRAAHIKLTEEKLKKRMELGAGTCLVPPLHSLFSKEKQLTLQPW